MTCAAKPICNAVSMIFVAPGHPVVSTQQDVPAVTNCPKPVLTHPQACQFGCVCCEDWTCSLKLQRATGILWFRALVQIISKLFARADTYIIRLEATVSTLEAVAIRLEAIASRLEAIATSVEAIAIRLEVITIWLEAMSIRFRQQQ